MSLFDDIARNALAPVAQELGGESVTLLTPAGATSTVTVQSWIEGPAKDVTDDTGTTIKYRATVSICESVVADPPIRSRLTRLSEVWSVIDRRRLPGGVWELTAERIGSVERARPGYRGS